MSKGKMYRDKRIKADPTYLKKESARRREWNRLNPEKKKEQNAEWNKKHRNEYQRNYRAKQKIKNKNK